MDRPGPDYAAAMAFAQQQQAAAANVHPPQQQPQFGFHPPPQQQHQQYPPPGGGHGSFLPPHPSHQQQFPYGRPPVQQPQYPHPPHMLHMQQQQQRPPPAFQPHIPPPHGPPPFHSPYDSSAPSPPPPPPPPSDPELQKRIDKLVEYAAKNGPEFEAMIREKQKDNPDYGFLFGGDGYNYYRDKLWMATRPPPAGHFNPPYPAQSMPIMHPLNPIMGPNAPPQLGGSPNPAASSGMVGAPHLHQGPFPPFYEQNHPQHPMFGGHIRPDYDQTPYRPFRGLSRPLPADVEMELNNVLTGLTGTKESIKGAKNWFMQRSPFIPALAEALRDRIFALDDSERQLHIVYLANDILFDSLQRRVNPHELDNEALAFKPVLGSMLARIYHNPQNKEENQSRLQKIVQFWSSKEVYDPNTIRAFENEMMGGMHMNPYPGGQRDLSSLSPDPSASAGLANQAANQTSWHLNKQQAAFPSLPEQEYQDKQVPPMQQPPLLPQQFLPGSVPSSVFTGSAALMLPSMQQPTNLAAPGSHTLPTSSVGGAGEKLPPYPLFPPGLIPGMVRKMQIGSGVPYSPMSPLDIPTVIPPSNVSPSEILERVSKFFKEIGEVNPSEGPMKPCESSGGGDDYDDYEREPSVRKGGACIPPPPNLLVDPESGGTHHPDERKPPGGSTSSDSGGGHRLGLGAASSANNPNEISQYDDVYSSYRKQRSTNYHTCMSARSATTTTTTIK